MCTGTESFKETGLSHMPETFALVVRTAVEVAGLTCQATHLNREALQPDRYLATDWSSDHVQATQTTQTTQTTQYEEIPKPLFEG